MPPIQAVCVFCGSSSGNSRHYEEAAVALAQELVRRKLTLVYGGGSVGLMGTLARAVREGLGDAGVIGVIPSGLIPREVSGEMIGTIHEVPDMHTRKEKMILLSDAFIGLPGGFGTLDEILEVTTGLQLGYHTKPVGVLNIPVGGGSAGSSSSSSSEGFFDPLLAQFRLGVREGFIKEANLALVQAAKRPSELLDAMEAFTPPAPVIQAAQQREREPESAVGL